MNAKPPATDAANIDELAKKLQSIPDQTGSPEQADELIDEVSQLLWAVSSLDPDAEKHATQSSYFARPSDGTEQAG